MSNYRSEGIWVFPKSNLGHWINLNTDQWHHPHFNIIMTIPKCELYVIIQLYIQDIIIFYYIHCTYLYNYTYYNIAIRPRIWRYVSDGFWSFHDYINLSSRVNNNVYIYILIVDVLLQGNSVIRPVAFKPGSMRFTDNGERYGSTPILARSSHRHLYGSKYIYIIVNIYNTYNEIFLRT